MDCPTTTTVAKRHWEESNDEGEEDKDSDFELELDTIRDTQRRIVIKEDYSSSLSSEGEEKGSSSMVGKGFKKELFLEVEKDDLSTWTRVEVNGANLNKGEYFKIEPFNMNEELLEGKFDKETGSYIIHQDPNIRKDTWLLGITEESMEKARKAEEIRLKSSKPSEGSLFSQLELFNSLISLLQLGETPMEALVRLAPTSGTRKFDSRSKRLGGGYNKALPPQDKVANMERCRQIERITEACTLLLERGITDIYEMSREEMNRMVNTNI